MSSLGLPLFLAIFVDHENGGNRGKQRDDTCKACWMKETLQANFDNGLKNLITIEVLVVCTDVNEMRDIENRLLRRSWNVLRYKSSRGLRF